MKIMADGNLLLSWTEGEAENVWSSILDTTGQVLVPPTLFGGSNGKHASPRIINTVKSDGSPVIYMLALSEDTDLNLVSYKVYDSAEKPLLGGNIRITGTPRVGSTLNVDNSGLLNQKGSLIYQWKRDGELILTNGNGDTYIPIEADIGKQISITVTAAENTGSVTSPPTAAVEAEQEIDECFIATAAFGSKFTWPVVLLRQFRDQYLLQHTWGKAFVTFYYQHSPGWRPLLQAVRR